MSLMESDIDSEPSGHSGHTMTVQEILPPEEDARVQTIARLSQGIRKNDFNLPTHIYRPDAIPDNLFDLTPAEQAQAIALATIGIDYSEGYPQIDQIPFWEQLSFESDTGFALFQLYLNLTNAYGYRAISLLVDATHPKDANKTMLPAGMSLEAIRKEKLLEYRKYYVYNAWGPRSRAFDMLGAAAYTRLRERRAMELDNFHFMKLDKLIKPVYAKIQELANAGFEDMDAKQMVTILRELASLQRISVGLPAQGPSMTEQKNEARAPGVGIEVTLRNIAKQSAVAQDSQTQNTSSENTKKMLEDPHAMAMAQELIVKLLPGSTSSTQNPSAHRAARVEQEPGQDQISDDELDAEEIAEIERLVGNSQD